MPGFISVSSALSIRRFHFTLVQGLRFPSFTLYIDLFVSLSLSLLHLAYQTTFRTRLERLNDFLHIDPVHHRRRSACSLADCLWLAFLCLFMITCALSVCCLSLIFPPQFEVVEWLTCRLKHKDFCLLTKNKDTNERLNALRKFDRNTINGIKLNSE